LSGCGSGHLSCCDEYGFSALNPGRRFLSQPGAWLKQMLSGFFYSSDFKTDAALPARWQLNIFGANLWPI